MAYEFFINAAWINAGKVPKATAGGIPLTFGVNAFRSVESAWNYADSQHFPMAEVVLYDFDKNVALDNATMKLQSIRSQEIRPVLEEEPAKYRYLGKSKVSPSGSIKVTRSDEVADLDIAGFKDVTISGGNGYSVHGGNNTVVHTDTEKIAAGSYTKKNVATLNGKAEGTLLLSGTSVSSAYGAWAKATGMYAFNYDIGTESGLCSTRRASVSPRQRWMVS